MSKNRLVQLLGRALMALGLGVGALAILFWVLGIRIEMPPWMWRIAIAKLALVGSVGLLAAGAILLRYLRRAELSGGGQTSTLPDESQRALGAPILAASARKKEPAPQRITTPPETRTP